MKKFVFNPKLSEKAIDSTICALFSAVLSGAALFGGYAPFAVGMVASAGNGSQGFCALIGAAVGSLLFLDFSHTLRTIAVCVLLFSANNAFYDLNIYRKPWFLPAMTGSLMLSVEFVYVLKAGTEAIAGCLVCLLVAAASSFSCRCVLIDRNQNAPSAAVLFVLLGIIMAVSAFETGSGFAPGRIFAMLSVILICFGQNRLQGIPAAFCIGLAVDIVSAQSGFLHTAAYGLSAIAMSFSEWGNRVQGTLCFLGGILLFSLPLYAQSGILLLYEALTAALCFILIPSRFLRGKREISAKISADTAWRTQLKNSAAALRELYNSISHVPKSAEENPSVIFDRAAEKVCRGCSLCNLCWEQDYTRSHSALNDAISSIVQNKAAVGGDFPHYFADRCIRFSAFLDAVNLELHNYLLRRSYRQKLQDVCQQSAGQYAEISEMLESAAEKPLSVTASAPISMPYQLGIALRPKKGESISGDSASTFEVGERLFIILSDGMGSGETAKKESAMAVRLLEKFLQVGIDPVPALKTLNSALAMRAESTDSFTTIDLLVLSLSNGEGELYKYGAAPSYVKRNGKVLRINCSCLPIGLQNNRPPEATRLHLEKGTYFVMLTDGVADAQQDEWLQNLLAGWEGDNPHMLTSAILADSIEQTGLSDDSGVIALYLPEQNSRLTEEV